MVVCVCVSECVWWLGVGCWLVGGWWLVVVGWVGGWVG